MSGGTFLFLIAATLPSPATHQQIAEVSAGVTIIAGEVVHFETEPRKRRAAERRAGTMQRRVDSARMLFEFF